MGSEEGRQPADTATRALVGDAEARRIEAFRLAIEADREQQRSIQGLIDDAKTIEAYLMGMVSLYQNEGYG